MGRSIEDARSRKNSQRFCLNRELKESDFHTSKSLPIRPLGFIGCLSFSDSRGMVKLIVTFADLSTYLAAQLRKSLEAFRHQFFKNRPPTVAHALAWAPLRFD
jgi:hypothetical protein